MQYQLEYTGLRIIRLDDRAVIPINDLVPEASYVEFKKWLADGNTPLPADPAPVPIDWSDLNNIEKGLKALALCVAQGDGLTHAQMNARFKQKWDSLP